MVVGRKKLGGGKALILIGTRVFVVPWGSIPRLFHRKRVFYISPYPEAASAVQSLSRFSTVIAKSDCAHVFVGSEVICLRSWNPGGLLDALSPLSLSSQSRLLIGPRSAYSWVEGPVKLRGFNLGGLILRGPSHPKTASFDAFRFYSSLLMAKSLSPNRVTLSTSAQSAAYPSRHLLKKAPYSRLTNFLVGILGRKGRKGHKDVTTKGRFVLRSLFFYLRKNTDSF